MAYALFGVLSSLLVIYAESAHAQSNEDCVPSAEHKRPHQESWMSFRQRQMERDDPQRLAVSALVEQALENYTPPPVAPTPDPCAVMPSLVLASSGSDAATGLWNSTRGSSEAEAIAHLYAIFCESNKHPARTKGCAALFEGMLEKLLRNLRVHDAESVKNAVEEYKRIYDIID